MVISIFDAFEECSHLTLFKASFEQIFPHGLVQRLIIICDLECLTNFLGQYDRLPIIDQALNILVLVLRGRVSPLLIVLIGPYKIVLRILDLSFDRAESLAIHELLVGFLHLILTLLKEGIRVRQFRF